MASLDELRESLASNVKEGYADWQVSGFLLGQPTAPGIEVVPGEVDYDQAFGGEADNWTLTIRAFVGMTTDIGAQKKLDALIAHGGVKAAAESDRTLGGLVSSLAVTKCSGYRTYKRADGQMLLGAEWTVSVYG